MSGFVTTGLAWAALALASIPIIIHLLNRRKLLRMDWAAMEFLLAALKKTRRKLRLEHLLLLLLRTLMMILLGLFLARPMLSDTEYSWLAGALKNEEKIFILDDSLSMSRQQAGGTAFGKGRGALAAELERLGSISSP
ncbi:MAG: BatA domain-containing protein, partial [Planctomycetota bacterium]|nr:BatA domain-containing protein [Planctomycetota bacterium]